MPARKRSVPTNGSAIVASEPSREDDHTDLAALHLYCDGWSIPAISSVSGRSPEYLFLLFTDCEREAAEDGVSLREVYGFDEMTVH